MSLTDIIDPVGIAVGEVSSSASLAPGHKAFAHACDSAPAPRRGTDLKADPTDPVSVSGQTHGTVITYFACHLNLGAFSS